MSAGGVAAGRSAESICRAHLEAVHVGWLGHRFGYKIAPAGRYDPAVDAVALRHLSLADAGAYYSLVDRNRMHLTRLGDYSFAVDATPELGSKTPSQMSSERAFLVVAGTGFEPATSGL